MPLKKSTAKAIELGKLMSPNIYKPPELEPIKDMPPEPKNWDTIIIHKPPEPELIQAPPPEPKIWDTPDVTKYS